MCRLLLRWLFFVCLFVLGEKLEKRGEFFLECLSEVVVRNRVVHSQSILCCGKESRKHSGHMVVCLTYLFVPIALDSGMEGADSAGVEGEAGSGLALKWSYVEATGQQISSEAHEANQVWNSLYVARAAQVDLGEKQCELHTGNPKTQYVHLCCNPCCRGTHIRKK